MKRFLTSVVLVMLFLAITAFVTTLRAQEKLDVSALPKKSAFDYRSKRVLFQGESITVGDLIDKYYVQADASGFITLLELEYGDNDPVPSQFWAEEALSKEYRIAAFSEESEDLIEAEGYYYWGPDHKAIKAIEWEDVETKFSHHLSLGVGQVEFGYSLEEEEPLRYAGFELAGDFVGFIVKVVGGGDFITFRDNFLYFNVTALDTLRRYSLKEESAWTETLPEGLYRLIGDDVKIYNSGPQTRIDLGFKPLKLQRAKSSKGQAVLSMAIAHHSPLSDYEPYLEEYNKYQKSPKTYYR
jgi:hypothetical protein